EKVLDKAGFLEEMMDCVELEDEQILISNYEVRKNAIEDNSILYGIAVVLSNITMYRKKLNETEEQILKLKKLSSENNNKSKNSDDKLDPLDGDEHVDKRNKKLLDLATDRSNHGLMVQQGAVKALIPLASMTTTITSTTPAKTTMIATKGSKENVQQLAKQALEKIAITMNPNLNLQLSDNTMFRRAATESLSDVKDFETRRAVSGCLPILSTNQDVRRMVLERPRDLLILKNLLDEQSFELQHRSVECLKNIASTNK
ncbi:16131_t:CDS:2, partial [Entrophospora sp. SA101]